MKKIAVLIGLVIVLAVVVSPASAIIGGEEDYEHTNVGAIVMVWPQFGEDFIGRLCSGTLIHKRVLLTAAHCIPYIENQGIDIDQVWVTFDQDALAEDATYLDIDEIILHPEFNQNALDSHDIALVILKKPVGGIKPKLLPSLGYLDEVFDQIQSKKDPQIPKLIMVGYGSTSRSEVPDNLLDAKRHSGDTSLRALLDFEIKSKDVSELDVSVCKGDSGGPGFHVNDQGDEVMVGVRHQGSEQCTGTGFHYRLDTVSASEWIKAELLKLKD